MGPLTEWSDVYSYISIFAQYHHGSDWAAIRIGSKKIITIDCWWTYFGDL